MRHTDALLTLPTTLLAPPTEPHLNLAPSSRHQPLLKPLPASLTARRPASETSMSLRITLDYLNLDHL